MMPDLLNNPRQADCLVIGAGLCGAVMARLLAEEARLRVLVVERRPHIGGNCYDYRDRNGITVHRYGSHIFHTTSTRVWNFLCRFTDFNTYQHQTLGAIDGIITHIPFNFNTLHEVFPPTLARRLERRLLRRFPYNARVPILELCEEEDEDLRFLARYIYEKIYLHYTRKQWDLDPEQISPATTARVPVCLSRDNRYFQDPFQGIPMRGYTALIAAILDHPGIEVHCNCDAGAFRRRHDLSGMRIFCTGSIDEYYDCRLGMLPYRSLRLVLEEHERPYYQCNSIINYPCDYDFTRIHEYKYYLGEEAPRTVIVKEYSEAFEPGRNERFYPVSTPENQALAARYAELAAQEHGVHFLGRLGDYRYYNMDNVVLRAMEVFDSLTL